MTRILIHSQSPHRHIARLLETHPEAICEGVAKNSALPDMLDQFRPDALFSVNITSDAPFPREAVLGCESLQWVSVGGSGTNHLAPWDPARLTVTNSAGVAAGMMVDYIMGCFIHFNIDVPGMMQDQRAKVWNPDRMVRPLAGQTLLIVGLGQTGQTLATRAKAFGMTVIGTRANPRTTLNCDEVHGADSLPQLWPRADFIAICTPRLPSTIGLVTDTAFALMKPDAVMVNVARGDVVEEPALIAALQENRLRGAAFDVFSTEPLPEDDPIWDAPNLLISPHCSAVHQGWEKASVKRFIRNLTRFQAGEALENIVDPARGY